MIKYITNSNDVGKTLYKLTLKIFPNMPISKIEKLFRTKDIKVNGIKTNNKKMILEKNSEIVFYCKYEQNNKKTYPMSSIKKHNFLLKIIYEDNNILIVNKPNNLVVHGKFPTLDDLVKEHLLIQNNDENSITFSHIGRLDFDTSGIMLYAKNYQTLRFLLEHKNIFQKTYWLINNMPIDFNQTIKVKIANNVNNNLVTVFPFKNKNGKEATTHFYYLNKQLCANISTGRKHQIRATAAFLGFPILGDNKYKGDFANRFYLHCYQIEFNKIEGFLNYLSFKKFNIKPLDYDKWKEYNEKTD